MKKIINKVTTCFLIFTSLLSCQSKDKEQSKTNAEILQEVTEVKAVGKVIPAEEWAVISSTTTAAIRQVLIQEGDTVHEGQTLIILDAGTADFDVNEAKAKLISQQKNSLALSDDWQKARIAAQELKNKYETSKRLATLNAETKEQLDTDYSAWQQQELVVSSIQKQIDAQRALENELRIQINKTESQQSDFQIIASKFGIITDLNAKVGQAVSSTEELGKILNPANPIVEAEVDELFADDVAVGQTVYLFASGRQDTLAQGKVSQASQILSNKSILYETPNEGEDRRVRKLKITTQGPNKLIINAKVDCSIKIK